MTDLSERPDANLRPRVALIGVTGYGWMHFDEIRKRVERGHGTFAGATVINPGDAPEQMDWFRQHEVPVFGDYTAMLDGLDGALDLCCIPTAISMHRPMVEAALRSGANVLVEKPLAGCPGDARAIVEAGEAAGRFVCVGFQAVWSPLMRRILAAVHEGRLGRIRRIAVRGMWPRPLSYFQRNGWAGRLADAHGVVNDSPANNALAHFLNLALLFAGPAPDRCARVRGVKAELLRANAIENYDTVMAEFQTDTGVDLFYGVTHACAESFGPTLDILGDQGRARYSMVEGEIVGADGRQEVIPGGEDAESRPILFENAFRAAAGEDAVLFPASEALAHVEAVAAMADAAEIEDRRDEAVPEGDTANPVMTLPGIDEHIHALADQFLARP